MTTMLKNKKVLLGIGGGIAVYRVAELARLLIRQGAKVRCVMTAAAAQFVSPLTFEALTGEQAYRELFDLTAEREMGHIQLARWADVLLVAPATADLIAKLAHGIADDLLSTLLRARRGPVLIAPAMNVTMWKSPAVRRNLGRLEKDGLAIVGPEEGELACGEEGMGRLSEPDTLIEAIYHAACDKTLRSQRWLINAGPTYEYWDAVRFLGNAASGTLGRYLALVAAARGAEVHLVAGPGVGPTPFGVMRHDIIAAADMLKICLKLAAGADVFVASAAVGDYRFAESLPGKHKRKNGEHLQLELVANEDIVARLAAMNRRPRRIVAFAAESEDHVTQARKKLLAKGVDAIVANDVGAMGRPAARAWWLSGNQTIDLGTLAKPQLAERLIELIAAMEKP